MRIRTHSLTRNLLNYYLAGLLVLFCLGAAGGARAAVRTGPDQRVAPSVPVLSSPSRPASSDVKIARAIRARFASGPAVRTSDVKLDVRKGVVYLSGWVPDPEDVSTVITDAWVPGVTRVEAPTLSANPTLLGMMQPIGASDGPVSEALQATLGQDPYLAPYAIAVDADSGAVALSGCVASSAQKELAGRYAIATDGVWEVNNDLVAADTRSSFSDRDLADQIRDAIAGSDLLEGCPLNVQVLDDRVVYAGRVATDGQRRLLWTIADELGARSIDDRALLVGPPWNYRPDIQIFDQITERLHASPAMGAGRVELHVRHGVATLTGHVLDWLAYKEASRLAMEGGALLVVNHLTVLHGPDRLPPVDDSWSLPAGTRP